MKVIPINQLYRIEINTDDKHNKFISGYIIGKYRNACFIKYDKHIKNSKIAYDYPEILPKYVKNKLRIELNKIYKD